MFRLGGGRIVLIDSGVAVPDQGKLLQLLQRENLRVAAVLTSHAHIDHIGNHYAIQSAHGSKVYMTPFAAAVSARPMNLKAYLSGMSYKETLSDGASMFCEADYIFRETDLVVDVEGACFKILALPGHAPEHVGFVTPDGVAYLADALLSDQVLDSVHIPYCMSCELDIQTKKIIEKMDYDSYILAHNAVYSCVKSIALRNREKLLEKIELVEGLAACPISMEKLVARASKRMGVPDGSVRKIRVAESSIRSFVEYLVDEGRLRQSVNKGVINYVKENI